MSEQLPDGFTQDAEGYLHKKFAVQRLNQAQRDAFANSSEDFDKFAENDSRRSAEADIDEALRNSLRNMDPEFRKIALPLDE